MRNYEAMIILQPGMEEEARTALVEKIQNIIVDNSGTILEASHLGVRRMAYEINKFREGYYLLLNFSIDGMHVGKLEKSLKITEEVLRYLVVRDESSK